MKHLLTASLGRRLTKKKRPRMFLYKWRLFNLYLNFQPPVDWRYVCTMYVYNSIFFVPKPKMVSVHILVAAFKLLLWICESQLNPKWPILSGPFDFRTPLWSMKYNMKPFQLSLACVYFKSFFRCYRWIGESFSNRTLVCFLLRYCPFWASIFCSVQSPLFSWPIQPRYLLWKFCDAVWILLHCYLC